MSSFGCAFSILDSRCVSNLVAAPEPAWRPWFCFERRRDHACEGARCAVAICNVYAELALHFQGPRTASNGGTYTLSWRVLLGLGLSSSCLRASLGDAN